MMSFILPVVTPKEPMKIRISILLPGLCAGSREGQASCILVGTTYKILGQEIIYFRKQDQKKCLESHRFCPKYQPKQQVFFYITREWEVEKGWGRECVSHGTWDFFCLCWLHINSLTHPKRWHIITNSHRCHFSCSARFRLPQRCYLHTFFPETENAFELLEHLLALLSWS